ncbi:endolytic transglycosylase MltG [Frigidibacter sp. MR17.14]|uniref:endolytic transglycosylase MltG n=1 Tax=Frigidibacter sp. MR17.14 TaxID=3126509 RepID=UPI0030131455
MWRAIASNFLTLAIVILVAVGGVIAWGQRQYVDAGPLANPVCLRVEPGSSMGRVSDNLEAQGAISSGYIFRVGADYEKKSGQLKAGSFLVPAGASMQSIVDLVTRGGQSTCGTEINYRIGVLMAEVVVRELDAATNRYVEKVKFNPATEAAPDAYRAVAEDGDTRLRVTLAEGATSWQVVDALKRADFLAGEPGEVPAEGMLAPDSYEVKRGEPRADLLAEMQRRQEAVLAEAWANRAQSLPYDTPEEALIMASLVEKETGVATERGRVASVFLNRLEQGMRLQTDPTVIYGITKGQGALGRGIRASELRRPTPYNTYQIDGLPPGPIANPGRESIRAALNPDQTDFLYFVADGSGGHAFARTLDEHNQNVRKWREIEASRGESDQGGTQTGTQTGN